MKIAIAKNGKKIKNGQTVKTKVKFATGWNEIEGKLEYNIEAMQVLLRAKGYPPMIVNSSNIKDIKVSYEFKGIKSEDEEINNLGYGVSKAEPFLASCIESTHVVETLKPYETYIQWYHIKYKDETYIGYEYIDNDRYFDMWDIKNKNNLKVKSSEVDLEISIGIFMTDLNNLRTTITEILRVTKWI